MLPATALVSVSGWNLIEWRELDVQLEAGRALLANLEIAEGGLRRAHPDTHGFVGAEPSRFQGSGYSSWRQMPGSQGDRVAMGNLVEAMDGEEIMRTLDDIARTRPSDAADRAFEERLLGRLVELDPEAALMRFSKLIPDATPAIKSHLANALRLWAGKNPKAASSWLDQQIDSGLFETGSLDGLDSARLDFEAALVGVLLVADPSAAGMRIAAIPEEQRRLVFESIHFPDLSVSAQITYVDLLREWVPGEENAGSLMHIVSKLAPEGGYRSVDVFLERIQATADERRVSAIQAAHARLGALAAERSVNQEDVDSMRSWVEKQSPDHAGSITGRTLAEVVQNNSNLSFEEASAMVLEYRRSDGSDDVLIAFLRSFAARSNLEQAASLIPMIQDEKVRQSFLDVLH